MNNAKMWLVVKPTVGIPLFLSAVAVGSFAVHVAVLSNTSWVSDFLSGKELGSGDASAALTSTSGSNLAALPAGSERITVVLPDGRTAVAVVQEAPTIVASNLAVD